jgi:hypothetical protein
MTKLPDSIRIKQSQPTNTQNQNINFMGYPKMGIILLFLLYRILAVQSRRGGQKRKTSKLWAIGGGGNECFVCNHVKNERTKNKEEQ